MYLPLSLLIISCALGSSPGPSYPPTEGEVWPQAQNEVKKDTFYNFSPAQFSIKITNKKCDILEKAVARFVPVLKDLYMLGRRHWRRALKKIGRRRHPRNISLVNMGVLREMQIDLTQPCEEYPHFEMDESYKLKVSEKSKLQSGSIWGILRGLETFAQLFYISDDFTEIRINSTRIVDYPRYPHRGLLLDTGRHYLSIANILKTLDAMAMNKMNVLHWHIVDDQSFPYDSEKFPELSEKGAYHSSLVYTKSDIRNVVEYARIRGIRVVPEIDVPGHTRSWGMAYPNLLAECYSKGKVTGLGPMDPTNNDVYKMLRDLFSEVQEWFPDDHFHVGGDEVDMSCWSSNPKIQEYMKKHNITETGKLHKIFMENVIPLLKKSTKTIVWQEVFDINVPLSRNTLVHVRKKGWTDEMVNVLKAGHSVLFSALWYLDIVYGYTFDSMYLADPQQMVLSVNKTLPIEDILGGEACMWGEMVDDRNLLSRVWPRASAVAEVLWSAPQSITEVSYETHRRIEEHACRMARRGIPAEPPSGPGFCIAN